MAWLTKSAIFYFYFMHTKNDLRGDRGTIIDTYKQAKASPKSDRNELRAEKRMREYRGTLGWNEAFCSILCMYIIMRVTRTYTLSSRVSLLDDVSRWCFAVGAKPSYYILKITFSSAFLMVTRKIIKCINDWIFFMSGFFPSAVQAEKQLRLKKNPSHTKAYEKIIK